MRCSYCRIREGLYCGGCEKYTCSICHLKDPHKTKCPTMSRRQGNH